MTRIGARELIDRILDAGSRTSWDAPPRPVAAPGSAYAAELAAARERSGCDEAVITGEGLLRGRRVAFVVSEFGFLAGSIGRATADRIVAAVERATAEGLPLLAAPSSGGTRMQEGTAAFVQMARITAAVMRHRAAGLPYTVYLRHPTTGGVLASWGSLGHVTAAEPGALIGFLGPRVYEALHGEPFPPGVQVAENLAAKGLVDAVVGIDDLPEVAARALAVLCAGDPPAVPPAPEPSGDVPGEVSAWESIERSRRPDRPGVRDLLRYGARDVTVLSGTGEGEAEPGLLLALARFGEAACVVVGQDRLSQRTGHPLGPAGLRVARRGMRLSRELGLPLLTVVDTPGAVLSAEAEERGLAGEIARCLAELTTLAVPTLCVLLGEGTGGAALALLPADRVLCARHGWLSPLPPEGASAIVHRTTERAAEMARAQGVRSADLLAAGIADRLLPECPDAAEEPQEFCARAAVMIAEELAALAAADPAVRMAARGRRFDGGA
ncbi:acetyl-CoA carboxylase carboxyl transferase subunit beta [Thermomonospora echinospora]|uniref:Acetyl-CoA carboxylase carboxyl transferase subunit beta n=1 Tax=Thermomonospora echinospora TaxID=1992 RepID=A0A1H6A053_9ACTN|nr:carboxyl transferase domain-containing protein [Thermomonospora echinospora]SEG41415.1 acetyl-CoA carboxylase carboxyl transferase subunit beta [Thermomonospora echinospora]